MSKEIRVLLVEDDFFSRNLMELLLRRDWRTKIVAELNSPAEFSNILEENNGKKKIKQDFSKVDLVLLDTDIPHDPHWLSDVLSRLAQYYPNTRILFTGVAPDLQVAGNISRDNFAGYILKGEIRYSLAWAVSLAAQQYIVITPGVYELFARNSILPKGALIMDGRKPVPIAGLSDLEKKRSRMAFIFSMERHEFAHEESISEDYSYTVVSELFDKMGLNDILEGREEPEAYFGNHPAVLTHLTQTLKQLKKSQSRKARDKETLAFHLLTLPDIKETGNSQ